MDIYNVKEIYDNGETVMITTETETCIHLPKGRHSVAIYETETPEDVYTVKLTVELFSR